MDKRLEDIYAKYIEEMTAPPGTRQNLGQAISSVLFGTKDTNYISRVFVREMEEYAASFAASEPGEDEIRALCDFILEKSLAYRDRPALSLMLTAMHSQLIPYVSRLSAEDAARYITLYDVNFPPKERTPVMKKLYAALGSRVR